MLPGSAIRGFPRFTLVQGFRGLHERQGEEASYPCETAHGAMDASWAWPDPSMQLCMQQLEHGSR